MDTYTVRKLEKKNIVVEVPGSKSITNRALLMAALSESKVTLTGVLFSDDSRYFLEALKELGFTIDIKEQEKTVTVIGCGGKIPKNDVKIYVGSAGTAARFLTAMLGLSGGHYIIDASEQMKKRPMAALFDAMELLGVKFSYLENTGFLPVEVLGREEKNGEIELDISKTSQPLSALLMTSVMNGKEMNIHIVSRKKTGSYIDITRKMMKQFGCDTEFDGETYRIDGKCTYKLEHYHIEPDVSAACYFYGIAAITGGSAIVKNVHFDTMQGDICFVKVLCDMGCSAIDTEAGIELKAPNDAVLKGITVDMNNFSDQALTLAAVSVFAEDMVKIQNIGHIRLQECDRLKAMVNELTRMGISVEEGEDYIIIHPGNTKKTCVETYDDHRVAMAFTLVGIGRGNITINNPMCCKKTFENYFQVIESLY